MEEKKLLDYKALCSDYFMKCEAKYYSSRHVKEAKNKFLDYCMNQGLPSECYVSLYKEMTKHLIR